MSIYCNDDLHFGCGVLGLAYNSLQGYKWGM
jgi:hypothetical protein